MCSTAPCYCYQQAVEFGGLDKHLNQSRRKPNLKNRVDETVETSVREFAIEFPAYGQVRASNELRKQGISISPSGVRSVWLRHNRESMKKRLAALDKESCRRRHRAHRSAGPGAGEKA